MLVLSCWLFKVFYVLSCNFVHQPRLWLDIRMATVPHQRRMYNHNEVCSKTLNILGKTREPLHGQQDYIMAYSLSVLTRDEGKLMEH